MSKLSEEILPIINYTFSAKWHPETTESREQIPFDFLQGVPSYSDFTSSVYDHPVPCSVVDKKPLFSMPSELNFTKAYVDWILNQKGAKRSDFRAHLGSIERTLLLQFKLDLPLIPKYLDLDYWLNNEIIIPTHFIDIETKNRMYFKFKSLILTNYDIDISVDKVNTINCTVFGYNPEVLFLSEEYVYKDFENWVNKDVEVHSYPDDINIFMKDILYSASISQSSNVSFVTYKGSLQSKELWYVYIPNQDGTFERLNGFINLSDYVLDFDTYNWLLIQSMPSFNVNLDIYDPDYTISQIYATTFNIDFKDNDTLLGSIAVYVTDLSMDINHIKVTGFGEYKPG